MEMCDKAWFDNLAEGDFLDVCVFWDEREEYLENCSIDLKTYKD